MAGEEGGQGEGEEATVGRGALAGLAALAALAGACAVGLFANRG